MARLYFRVKGRVQGVGYRWFVLETAERLELAGWVRNLPGGDVEGEAEGAAKALQGFLRALETGHPWAEVAGLASEPRPATGEKGFRITR